MTEKCNKQVVILRKIMFSCLYVIHKTFVNGKAFFLISLCFMKQKNRKGSMSARDTRLNKRIFCVKSHSTCNFNGEFLNNVEL